ncbi:Cellulose-growth-specific protein [Lachnellula suecica]|uniref:AA9 family lytic polysaccharide monooxygenase n=1 Tax=Lachnellula suecica TaxID=602035 RepID=A0A8T9CE32_9HELO|nr:Cellulose-growth-specific protein [Lachnellula suecica]
MKFVNLVSLVSLATTTFAHGGIYTYNIGDKVYQGNPWHTFDYGDGNTTGIPPDVPSIQRRWYFWPVYDILGANITCNWDGASTSQALHAPIAAGTNITAHYDVRQFNLTSVGQTAWSHAAGPLLAYMARCPGESCEGFDGSGAVWFKIAQYGLQPSATTLEGPWWQWDLIGDPGYNSFPSYDGFSVTIPESLKAGSYLIRHEVIMLASGPQSGSPGTAQFYPECAQLNVTGGGDNFPSDEYLVSFPGAYKPTDPGIILADWSIEELPVAPQYNTTDYVFPGPEVWTGLE